MMSSTLASFSVDDVIGARYGGGRVKLGVLLEQEGPSKNILYKCVDCFVDNRRSYLNEASRQNSRQ